MLFLVLLMLLDMSHPARGAWIEMNWFCILILMHMVAPRKGCVD